MILYEDKTFYNLIFYFCALVFDVFVIDPLHNASMRMAIKGSQNVYM
jgi:hypothetical protein